MVADASTTGEIVIGQCKTRGNSDVVYSYKPSTGIASEDAKGAGLVVFKDTDETIAVIASGEAPIGIGGITTLGTQEVIHKGVEVGVQIPAIDDPAIGDPVYMTSAGLITSSSDGTTALNATFSSTPAEPINPNTGNLVTASYHAAYIDFPGGL